jgi:hypothetical protein
MAECGQLDLSSMVTATLGLDDIDQGLTLMARG